MQRSDELLCTIVRRQHKVGEFLGVKATLGNKEEGCWAILSVVFTGFSI
jgi:hypothetical protein